MIGDVEAMTAGNPAAKTVRSSSQPFRSALPPQRGEPIGI
jgi:hypothetical protein